jgi:signal transduction histidine kinase/DNA-binding NarL/FixJ family response regulator
MTDDQETSAAALESLEDLESGLLEFERAFIRGEDARPLVHMLFRLAHNLKSSFGLLGRKGSGETFHAVESALELVRSGKRNATQELIDLLMDAIDECRSDISDGQESEELHETTRSSLRAFCDEVAGLPPEPRGPGISLSATQAQTLAVAVAEGMGAWLLEKTVSGKFDPEAARTLPVFETIQSLGVLIRLEVLRPSQDAPEGILVALFATALSAEELSFRIFDTLRPLSAAQLASLKAIPEAAAAAPIPGAKAKTASKPPSGSAAGIPSPVAPLTGLPRLAPEQPGIALPRILIVESEAEDLCLLQRMLASFGRIDSAATAEEAIAAFHLALDAQRYGLVFLDSGIVGQKGSETLGSMRRLEFEAGIFPGDGARIVMAAELQDFASVSSAFKNQCDLYLIKPLSAAKVAESLRKFGFERFGPETGQEEPFAGTTGEEESPDLLNELHDIENEFHRATTMEDFSKLVVKRGREFLDFDSIALLRYDAATETVRGTWGIDETGKLVDEHDFEAAVAPDDDFVRENLKKRNFLAVRDGRVLLNRGKAVGRGWNAMIALWSEDRVIGWITADNHLRHRPLLPLQRWLAVLFGQLVESHLDRKYQSESLIATVAQLTMERETQARELRKLIDGEKSQNSLKDRLFSVFAHDLRDPLGAMRGIVDMALSDEHPITGQDMLDLMPEIQRSIHGAFGLLENLLEWVRSQMDEITVLRQRLAAKDLASTVITSLSVVAACKNITIVNEISDDSYITGDSRIVSAILRNFLSNAIKFSPSGSRVGFASTWDGENQTTRLSVMDEGIGMSEEQQARIFTMDPGKRREGTEGEGGSGIGLVFCSDLATRLNAFLEVASEVGNGSVCSLVMPEPLDGDLESLDLV